MCLGAAAHGSTSIGASFVDRVTVEPHALSILREQLEACLVTGHWSAGHAWVRAPCTFIATSTSTRFHSTLYDDTTIHMYVSRSTHVYNRSLHSVFLKDKKIKNICSFFAAGNTLKRSPFRGTRRFTYRQGRKGATKRAPPRRRGAPGGLIHQLRSYYLPDFRRATLFFPSPSCRSAAGRRPSSLSSSASSALSTSLSRRDCMTDVECASASR